MAPEFGTNSLDNVYTSFLNLTGDVSILFESESGLIVLRALATILFIRFSPAPFKHVKSVMLRQQRGKVLYTPCPHVSFSFTVSSSLPHFAHRDSVGGKQDKKILP